MKTLEIQFHVKIQFERQKLLGFGLLDERLSKLDKNVLKIISYIFQVIWAFIQKSIFEALKKSNPFVSYFFQVSYIRNLSFILSSFLILTS